MEILDVYNDNNELTGKTVIRRQGKLEKGEHVKSVHVIIRNKDGLYLVQKRSIDKLTRPGTWDITCGAVSSGEDSLTSACRETKEEVGLDIDKGRLKYIGLALSPDNVFQEIYFADISFELYDCTMQKGEVEDLKLIAKDEMIDFVKSLTHRSDQYRNMIIDAIISGK